jgi:hypothetical protein
VAERCFELGSSRVVGFVSRRLDCHHEACGGFIQGVVEALSRVGHLVSVTFN